jgi:hypothetical protein
MKYSSRLFLWGPLALLLALALGASARWWSVAHDLSRRLDAWNGHEVVPGVTLSFASKTIGGFPFNIDAVFQDFRVKVDGPHGPISWRAEKFASHALTYGRAQWIMEAAGKQQLNWTTKKGEQRGLAFDAGSLHASAVFKDDELNRFDFDLVGFDSAALQIARTQLHARRNPDGDQLDVVASAEEMHLSPRLQGICGETIDDAKLESNFSNGRAFERALAGLAKWQNGFDDWRKAGGRFFLAQSEIACGKSNVFTQGQMGLDEQKRPRGLLTAQIAGFAGLRDGAAHNHSDGTFITALLNQAAEPSPAHEGRVTVRALFRDGMTYLGQTPAGMNDPVY